MMLINIPRAAAKFCEPLVPFIVKSYIQKLKVLVLYPPCVNNKIGPLAPKIPVKLTNKIVLSVGQILGTIIDINSLQGVQPSSLPASICSTGIAFIAPPNKTKLPPSPVVNV